MSVSFPEVWRAVLAAGRHAKARPGAQPEARSPRNSPSDTPLGAAATSLSHEGDGGGAQVSVSEQAAAPI